MTQQHLPAKGPHMIKMTLSEMAFRPALLASVAALTTATPAFAQDGDPIIVTGRGLEATASQGVYSSVEFPADQIEGSASGRIEDALKHVAGFQQFRRSDSRSANPTAQGATLRSLGGNASSRALVTLDGVPMVDPFFGHVPFAAISPDRVSNITLTRGGGSGPFGAGALAGTIALESGGAGEGGLLRASALVNNRGDSELSASIAPEIGSGFAELSGRWDRGQGFWTTPEDQRVPASVRAGYDGWSVGGRVVQRLGSDIELQARALAWDDQRTLRFAGAQNTNEGQDVSLRLVGRGDWQFDALAYGQWRNFSNIVISSTLFTKTLDQKDTPASGFGGKLELRPPVGDDRVLRLGADYRQAQGDLAEDAFSAVSGALTGQRFAGGENSDLGLFAELEQQAGPVLLTGGVRADRWSITNGYFRSLNGSGGVIEDSAYADRDGWDVTWRAGARVNLGSGLALRGAAYSGLRLPTLNELYRPFVVFPVTTLANAALENEHLTGFEAGLDFRPSDAVQFSLTAFDNRVEDAIANATIGVNLRQRQNLPAIDVQGLEFDARIGGGPISLTASVTLTDASVDGSGAFLALDGLTPSQTPDFAASATLAWNPQDDIRLALTLRHVADQFEDDLETDVLPAATTLDFFGTVPLGRGFALVVRGENLFDAQVITRNQAGSMDQGAPLTVWGGVRFGY
jgi:vitamin B12 transporter